MWEKHIAQSIGECDASEIRVRVICSSTVHRQIMNLPSEENLEGLFSFLGRRIHAQCCLVGSILPIKPSLRSHHSD